MSFNVELLFSVLLVSLIISKCILPSSLHPTQIRTYLIVAVLIISLQFDFAIFLAFTQVFVVRRVNSPSPLSMTRTMILHGIRLIKTTFTYILISSTLHYALGQSQTFNIDFATCSTKTLQVQPLSLPFLFSIAKDYSTEFYILTPKQKTEQVVFLTAIHVVRRYLFL